MTALLAGFFLILLVAAALPYVIAMVGDALVDIVENLGL